MIGAQRNEFSDPINQRIYAAAELAALAVLFAANVWGQIHVGVVGWGIVAAWYIWRRWNNPLHLQEHDWLIGLFRDRVLLLSNQAAPQI